MEDKIDRILEELAKQNARLAVHEVLHRQNTRDLKHHIKRTDLLEKRVLVLDKTDHVLKTSIKGVGVVSLVCSIIVAISKIMGAQ